MSQRERKSLGGRMLDSLEEVHAWIKGENEERVAVHLPDGTTREMTFAEHAAWRREHEGGEDAGV